MEEIWALAIGVAAALAFPAVAVFVHTRRERRRNRKSGKPRTDKIDLAGRECPRSPSDEACG